MNKHRLRYDDPETFFQESGSGWMKLSKNVAIEVVQTVLETGGAVMGVEGGIWHNPGFEARIDAITSFNYKLTLEHEQTDGVLRDYFTQCPEAYDTFIVTAREKV